MNATAEILHVLTRHFRRDADPGRRAVDLLAQHDTASDTEDYPGELAMLRGLVRTLRVVVREDASAEKQRAEVRQLLHEHASDDAEAREKSSPAGADATPQLTVYRAGHDEEADQ